MKPLGVIVSKISGFNAFFVVWGIIVQVKSDADFENDICKRIPQRLGEV